MPKDNKEQPKITYISALLTIGSSLFRHPSADYRYQNSLRAQLNRDIEGNPSTAAGLIRSVNEGLDKVGVSLEEAPYNAIFDQVKREKELSVKGESRFHKEIALSQDETAITHAFYKAHQYSIDDRSRVFNSLGCVLHFMKDVAQKTALMTGPDYDPDLSASLYFRPR